MIDRYWSYSTAHMTPRLEDLFHVEKYPDISIDVDADAMLPYQDKCTSIIEPMDDDGHPIRLTLPKFLYVTGLTKETILSLSI
jgi:hypothetical protein